jgi:hypothetical protein
MAAAPADMGVVGLADEELVLNRNAIEIVGHDVPTVISLLFDDGRLLIFRGYHLHHRVAGSMDAILR